MRFSDVSNIKKPIRISFTSSEMVCQHIMLSWSLIIDINVKNIKNDKILWEKPYPRKCVNCCPSKSRHRKVEN